MTGNSVREPVSTADQHDLEASIAQTWPQELWRTTRLLLGVSGGADSVALLRAMLRLCEDPDLIDVAHFNHCWRAEESDNDERFVRELCDSHAVRAFFSRADEESERQIEKTEESARDARYAFLSSVAYQTGARYVLTAHTASDQVETMLHNLFRGTGLAGVSGMRVTRCLDAELVLARPLLNCSRLQVIDYLESLSQTYRNDSSNLDESFRRNYLRQTMLPSVREQYGDATDERLLSFSEIALECDEMLAAMADEYLTSAESLVRDTKRQGQFGHLDDSMFALPKNSKQSVYWPVLQRALKFVWVDRSWPLGSMTHEHWTLIRDLHTASIVSSERAWKVRTNLPGNLQVLSNDTWLIIRPIPMEAAWARALRQKRVRD